MIVEFAIIIALICCFGVAFSRMLKRAEKYENIEDEEKLEEEYDNEVREFEGKNLQKFLDERKN
jgi:hypothetical protein